MEKSDYVEKKDEITLYNLVELISSMRTAQKEYFKTRNKGMLYKSKELESRVDKLVASIKAPEQKTIFDAIDDQDPGLCQHTIDQSTGTTKIDCCNLCGLPKKGQNWTFNFNKNQ